MDNDWDDFNCFILQLLSHEANLLRLRLRQRGYSHSLLKTAYKQALIKTRGSSSILNLKHRKNQFPDLLPYIAINLNRLSQFCPNIGIYSWQIQ